MAGIAGRAGRSWQGRLQLALQMHVLANLTGLSGRLVQSDRVCRFGWSGRGGRVDIADRVVAMAKACRDFKVSGFVGLAIHKKH